ncbi:hypothetical protein GOODEAATRI_021568, partial [Goodea atripinnis]
EAGGDARDRTQRAAMKNPSTWRLASEVQQQCRRLVEMPDVLPQQLTLVPSRHCSQEARKLPKEYLPRLLTSSRNPQSHGFCSKIRSATRWYDPASIRLCHPFNLATHKVVKVWVDSCRYVSTISILGYIVGSQSFSFLSLLSKFSTTLVSFSRSFLLNVTLGRIRGCPVLSCFAELSATVSFFSEASPRSFGPDSSMSDDRFPGCPVFPCFSDLSMTVSFLIWMLYIQ